MRKVLYAKMSVLMMKTKFANSVSACASLLQSVIFSSLWWVSFEYFLILFTTVDEIVSIQSQRRRGPRVQVLLGTCHFFHYWKHNSTLNFVWPLTIEEGSPLYSFHRLFSLFPLQDSFKYKKAQHVSYANIKTPA